MQFARLNDVTLHYQVIGSPQSRPTIVFVNSLGTDFRIWRDVVVRLVGEFALVTYDKRGHGLSEVGKTPYSMHLLAADLAALLDHLGVRRATICGVSVGGLVAQQLYHDRPDLVETLVLCDTLDKMGDSEFWNRRIAAIEANGLASIADGILERWFTAGFRSGDNPDFAGYRAMLSRQPADGYVATCVALREADLRDQTRNIAAPTIVIAGDQDASPTPRAAADFARSIPGARLEIIKGCGHIPSVEQPETLSAILRAFMSFVGTETASHVSH